MCVVERGENQASEKVASFLSGAHIAESEPPPSVLRQKLRGKQRHRKLCRRKERLRYTLMEGVCCGEAAGRLPRSGVSSCVTRGRI